MSTPIRKQPQSATADLMQARLPKGTFKRMDRVLKGGELRSHFLRTAVEAELRKREGAAKKRELQEPAQQLEAAE